MDLLDLWLPILVAAVALFFAAFLAHMVLPHHRKDFLRMPDEETLLEYLRSSGASAGQYMFPGVDNWGDSTSPEFQERYKAGPNGIIRIWPEPPSLVRNLVQTFVYYILVGCCVAYLSVFALAPGAEFLPVFRFTAAAAIMGYSLGLIPALIWHGHPMGPFLHELVDNVVYGLITGLIFALLWPGAPVA